MIVVDIPVYTSQDAISRSLDIVSLPRACAYAISVVHIVRQALEFRKSWATIGG